MKKKVSKLKYLILSCYLHRPSNNSIEGQNFKESFRIYTANIFIQMSISNKASWNFVEGVWGVALTRKFYIQKRHYIHIKLNQNFLWICKPSTAWSLGYNYKQNFHHMFIFMFTVWPISYKFKIYKNLEQNFNFKSQLVISLYLSFSVLK